MLCCSIVYYCRVTLYFGKGILYYEILQDMESILQVNRKEYGVWRGRDYVVYYMGRSEEGAVRVMREEGSMGGGMMGGAQEGMKGRGKEDGGRGGGRSEEVGRK